MSPFIYIQLHHHLTRGNTLSDFASFFPISYWKAVANVERAIMKSLEKQYSDILTPLKDSIPKRLHLQVQKLARRQSATVQLVPNQVSSLYAYILSRSWNSTQFKL